MIIINLYTGRYLCFQLKVIHIGCIWISDDKATQTMKLKLISHYTDVYLVHCISAQAHARVTYNLPAATTHT